MYPSVYISIHISSILFRTNVRKKSTRQYFVNRSMRMKIIKLQKIDRCETFHNNIISITAHDAIYSSNTLLIIIIIVCNIQLLPPDAVIEVLYWQTT